MKYVVFIRVLPLLICSWLLLNTITGHAGYFQKQLIDNNLPNVGIYSITQDQNGYLWLASTNIGLVQYDGYQFQHHPLLNRSLTKLKSVPDIDALAFDQHNNLWAGSWGYGLAKISATDGNIELFNGEPDDQLASPFVQTLFKDKQQRLWIGTTQGINRYSDNTGLVRVDSPDDAMPSRRIWAFAQTPDNTIWIGTSVGLYRWQSDKGLRRVVLPAEVIGSNETIRALHVVGQQLWLGTNDGLYNYAPDSHQLTALHLPDEQPLPIINALATSIEGHLLIGTFSGIYAVEPEKMRFVRRFQHKLVELEHINIRTFFIDKSQVTWVGTREGGLYFQTRQRRAFQNTTDAALARLQHDISTPVLSLLAEPEQLWLGQYGNVSRYNHLDQQRKQFTLPGRVNVIQRAPDGSLWVGTDNGIFQLTDEKSDFIRMEQPFISLGLPQQNARDIRFTDDNKTLINLWNNGVVLTDNGSGVARQFLPDIGSNIIGDAIQAVAITPDNIWLASRLSGIYQLNRKTLDIQQLHLRNTSPLLAPEYTGQLTCLDTAPGNKLIACTEKGLLIINLDNNQVALLDQAAGLGASALIGAHTDAQKNVWLLSTTGLSVLKPDGTITHFNQMDGLNSSELMFRAVAEDQRQLYFGSGAGLELINPNMLLAALPETQQAISKVSFEQKASSMQQRLTPLQEINIPPGVSRLGFHFASFDFNNPKRNSYRYKLDGYDKDWQLLQDNNVATYTNLAPGNYRLQMVASNNQRHFNDNISTLDVAVLPYWWQRKSVQFFAVLLLIMLSAWVVKRRIDQIHKMNALLQQAMQQKNLRQAELENAVAERTTELQLSLVQQKQAYDELQHLDLLKDEFISTVSHELRTPLTSISGALQLVLSGALSADTEKMQHLLQIANSNSKRLTLLINDLLDLEKLAANKMHFELAKQPIHPIVQRAVAENSTYGQERRVNLQYQATDESQTAIALVDEYRLLQVLANVLSNAIKFSPQGGTVTVQLYNDGSQLTISITDEGPGIAPEFQPRIFQRFSQANSGNTRQQGGTGLGLALSQELMNAMHGEISFISTPGEGCTFYLHLPLKPEKTGA